MYASECDVSAQSVMFSSSAASSPHNTCPHLTSSIIPRSSMVPTEELRGVHLFFSACGALAGSRGIISAFLFCLSVIEEGLQTRCCSTRTSNPITLSRLYSLPLMVVWVHTVHSELDLCQSCFLVFTQGTCVCAAVGVYRVHASEWLITMTFHGKVQLFISWSGN